MLIVIDDPWKMAIEHPNSTKKIGEHVLSNDWTLHRDAAAVVFHIPTLYRLPLPKSPNQYWIGWSLESELFYPFLFHDNLVNFFDLTISYHRRSDIQISYFQKESIGNLLKPPRKKIPGKICSCFISNIDSHPNSGKRLAYIEELNKYIPIDFYGKFKRNKILPEDRGLKTKLEIIAQYKFNLAFENCVAEDYVTEKFFQPLEVGTVPIYLGAPNIEDFIPGNQCFVDVRKYASPQVLAEYLLHLDQTDSEYQKYLEWKNKPLLPSFLKLYDVTSSWEALCQKILQLEIHNKKLTHYKDLIHLQTSF